VVLVALEEIAVVESLLKVAGRTLGLVAALVDP